MTDRTDPRTGALRRPDEARRFRDIIALHQTVLTRDELIAGRFVAIRLSDGGSDGQVYDNRADAMRFQKLHPALYFYVQIPMLRWNEFICDSLLWYARSVYDAGYRPQAEGEGLMIPQSMEDVERVANAARHN